MYTEEFIVCKTPTGVLIRNNISNTIVHSENKSLKMSLDKGDYDRLLLELLKIFPELKGYKKS